MLLSLWVPCSLSFSSSLKALFKHHWCLKVLPFLFPNFEKFQLSSTKFELDRGGGFGLCPTSNSPLGLGAPTFLFPEEVPSAPGPGGWWCFQHCSPQMLASVSFPACRPRDSCARLSLTHRRLAGQSPSNTSPVIFFLTGITCDMSSFCASVVFVSPHQNVTFVKVCLSFPCLSFSLLSSQRVEHHMAGAGAPGIVGEGMNEGMRSVSTEFTQSGRQGCAGVWYPTGEKRVNCSFLKVH